MIKKYWRRLRRWVIKKLLREEDKPWAVNILLNLGIRITIDSEFINSFKIEGAEVMATEVWIFENYRGSVPFDRSRYVLSATSVMSAEPEIRTRQEFIRNTEFIKSMKDMKPL